MMIAYFKDKDGATNLSSMRPAAPECLGLISSRSTHWLTSDHRVLDAHHFIRPAVRRPIDLVN